MDFGEGDNPMGSRDPSDYFNRISVGNNLFRVISKRYTTTQVRWVGGKRKLQKNRTKK